MESKLSKARDLLLSEQIDPADYRAMKSEYEERLNRLKVKLEAETIQVTDFDMLLNHGLANLFRLSEIYENGSIIENDRSLVRFIRKNSLSMEIDFEPPGSTKLLG